MGIRINFMVKRTSHKSKILSYIISRYFIYVTFIPMKHPGLNFHYNGRLKF